MTVPSFAQLSPLLLLLPLFLSPTSSQQQQQWPSQHQQPSNFQPNPSSPFSNATNDCLLLAQNRECPVFIQCCQQKCPHGQPHRHKCFSFLGMIDPRQTACDCPTFASLSSANGSPFGGQSGGQFGQQSGASTSQWPSSSNFGGGQPNAPSSWPSSSTQSPWPSWHSSSSSFPPPSYGQSAALPSPSGGPSPSTQFQRPPPGDPSALRPLFQSIAGFASSSAQSSHRLQRIRPSNWWADVGRKADFVGAIVLLFVLDLLLLSLTL